jgi:Xaa-Pro aminopeptidase
MEKAGDAKALIWKPVSPNPVDALWRDRPPVPESPVFLYPPRYSGCQPGEKRRMIAETLREKGLDAAMLTAPDSVCWLLDIRGRDVPYTPFVLCYALLKADGAVTLFAPESRFDSSVKAALGGEVRYRPMQEWQAISAELRGKKVLYDPASSPVSVRLMLESAGADVQEGEDPCQLPKACKNAAEIAAIREAHRLDGLAVVRFLHDLSRQWRDMDEVQVHERITAERAKSDLFLEPSFHTIAGSGPNGAIVHYRAAAETTRRIDADSLLLIDSGGQYLGGTTDITRTVAIGTPSQEMKRNFTRVLKGHIALARAVFPEGTGGQQLDALARQYLWEAGLDYDHGTGHGVGACLSVHEGPQRISKKGPATPLKPGMVVSNEPGYYKTGEYGIRIESLVVVTEKPESPGFLGFDTLTLAPVDRHAMEAGMLTAEEKAWLNAYHRSVYETHAPHLDENRRGWLASACAEIL